MPPGAQNDFPPILSVTQMLPPAGHLEISRSDLAAIHSVSQPRNAAVEEAFHLVIILHLLVSNHEKSKRSLTSRCHNTLYIWQELQRRTRHQANLELLAGELLESIAHVIMEHEDLEIENILQTAFHFDHSHSRTIRAIDLLPHPGIPPNILCHPLITIAVSMLWKHDKARSSHDAREILQKLVAIYDSTSAPRYQHALHLVFHLAYVVILGHLILVPAPLPVLLKTPGGPIGFREPLVAIYSISNIFFRPFLSLLCLPHILVMASFLFSLPASPSPGTAPYDVLLCAFCFHIMFLFNVPIAPSPLFLVEPSLSLPLSSLYYMLFLRPLLLVFLFFLPIIFISAILLFISLADILQSVGIFVVPSAARLTFLGLLSLTLFLMIFFSAFVIFNHFSINGTNASRRDWDRYGVDAGLLGRRALIQATSLYLASPSGSVAFPPPLNLLSSLLTFLRLSERMKLIIWRIVVGPLALFIAAFWCWGLL